MLFFMIDLSLSLFSVPLRFCHHKSCLIFFFSKSFNCLWNYRTAHGCKQSNPFDTQLEIPVEFSNLLCGGCSDFPRLAFEILTYQNDKQEKARCLTEVLCVTTIILSAQIMTPFKECVEAGNSLFSLEGTRVMLIIYLSVIFLCVNDSRDLSGQLFLSVPGLLVITFIRSLGFIFLNSTSFPTVVLFYFWNTVSTRLIMF